MASIEGFYIIFFTVFVTVYFLLFFISYIIGYKIAKYKNRNTLKWGIFSALTGIVGLTIVAALPKKEKKDEQIRS